MTLQYETMIQPALWVLTIGAGMIFAGRAAFFARKRKMQHRVRRELVKIGVALIVALVIVPSIGIVPPGQRGVVYFASGGISPSERGEGFTILVPWLQHMRNLSVRTQKLYSDKVFAQSLDLQEITAVTSVNYHVRADKAAELYQNVGPTYEATVIQPALFQRTKAAIGQIRAEDFAANRGPLATTIEAQLTDQLAPYGIVVEFVNIEDAIFDPIFVQAVKDKIIAEQEALRQRRLIQAAAAIKQQVIIQAQATARSIYIEAKAQAKANRVLAESISPRLLSWQWLVTWNGMVPSTLVAGGGSPTLLINPSEQAMDAWQP